MSAAAYGGDGVFTQLPAGAWKGIPVAANEQRPHFVRDDATSTEYLISTGAQIVSSAAERASITSTVRRPRQVWPLVGGALSGVRINYDLMVKGASGEVYLMDGDTRYRTSGCGAATDFGRVCAGLRTPHRGAAGRDARRRRARRSAALARRLRLAAPERSQA